jgi:hypothetical protein
MIGLQILAMRGRNMGRVLTHVSLATLVAAGSLAYLAKQVSSAVEAGGAEYSRGVLVTDGDGYFRVTLRRLPLIFSADFVPG